MRPVRRDTSPRTSDFSSYSDAQTDLVARLGIYCSYCERRVATQLAVEHIQPKGLPAYAHLVGCWENYLLGCVNCNSTKKDKDVHLERILLPDRDNTFAAFTYHPDGSIAPSPSAVSNGLELMARRTLELTGLDRPISIALDENGKQVALDRVAQRMEVWAVAEDARCDVTDNPGNDAVRRGAVRTALGYGFFSIWMTIFEADTDMRNRLVDAFSGTRQSECFDVGSAAPISPAPNPDGLPHGGKI